MERCVVCRKLKEPEEMIGRCDKLVGDVLAETAGEVSA